MRLPSDMTVTECNHLDPNDAAETTPNDAEVLLGRVLAGENDQLILTATALSIVYCVNGGSLTLIELPNFFVMHTMQLINALDNAN